MPSFTLAPAGPGYWSGWQSIVGAPSAWEAVRADDGDASYIRLPALGILPNQAGRASIRISQMGLSDLRPTFARVDVTARVNIAGGSNATIVGGFSDAHQVVAVGSPMEITMASYFVLSFPFSVNPYTFLDWKKGELAELEPYVAIASFPIPNQQVRVTSIQVFVINDDLNYWEKL